MLAGLASPSHLILILVLVLLLFGAKRIPELARGLGTGLKEVREGITSGNDAKAEAPEGAGVRGGARVESEDAAVRSGRGGL
jgi:sec-independent protein translocase protein TatA